MDKINRLGFDGYPKIDNKQSNKKEQKSPEEKTHVTKTNPNVQLNERAIFEALKNSSTANMVRVVKPEDKEAMEKRIADFLADFEKNFEIYLKEASSMGLSTDAAQAVACMAMENNM